MKFLNLNYFFNILILLLLVPSTIASPKQDDRLGFSMFYTDDELEKQEVKIKKAVSPRLLHKIYLQALFYSNSQIWTLWINDHKVTSTEPHPLYQIQQVTAEYVILDWKYEGKFHRVQLRPNQSYDATRGQVFEGLL